MTKQRTIYAMMSLGGIIGVIAAFLQTIEKFQLLTNKNALLVCDLSIVFNCSTVLNAWQSSVFGFPNSLLCLLLFTIFTSIAIAGASEAILPRRLRLTVHLLTFFTLCFAVWFLTQSIYVINALCLLCIFCFAGLLLLNWSWLRTNANDLPIGKQGRAAITYCISRDIDTLFWLTCGIAMALAMTLRFI